MPFMHHGIVLYYSFSLSVFVPLQMIDSEINPYVDQWEEEGQFPAHEVFKKFGDAGFLGITKPVGEKASC